MIKSKLSYIFFIPLLFLVYLLAHVIIKNSGDPCDRTSLKNVPDSSSQVIVVNLIKDSKVEVTACQKQGGLWTRALKSFLAVVGKAGIAPVGEKKEGDMKTPAGLYPLGEAFGTEPLALKMDYRYITTDDKFVDDVTNKNYNTWVKGKTDAKSFESMLIKEYKMGIVINYNMNPVVPGAGSAIFMHLWRSIDVPTLGCIAMDEQHLLKLLHWLDKQQHPYILITN